MTLPWTLPGNDLKIRLTMQVVAVSMACFAAMSIYALVDAERSARTRIDEIAAIVAKDQQLQQDKLHWMRMSDPPAEFPDLRTIASLVMAPGLCIAYRTKDGKVLQRFCSGSPGGDGNAPVLFATLYRRLFDPGREAAQPVYFQDEKIGEAVAWADPGTLAAEAWQATARLLGVIAVTLLLLCGLVYVALARALQPTRLICAGLERIAANDLSARLPPFDLAELSAIGVVFNQLAESLQRTLDERRELTRRLIALQDDERRYLARELHDEFGQCLAAIRALAASAGQTAAQDCPAIASDCEGIERTAARMSESLRGALFRLRPPDVEELGLVASLEGLVAGWNSRARGRTRFEIRFCGDFDDLPPALSAGLYRVAQEAITNAAKHSDATRVVLQLTKSEAASASGSARAPEIELTVDDDGRAGEAEPSAKAGMGFLGMRERAATLGGRLSFEAGQKCGSVLRVVVPAASTPMAGHGAMGRT
jgi:signal transduction histidine kinase